MPARNEISDNSILENSSLERNFNKKDFKGDKNEVISELVEILRSSSIGASRVFVIIAGIRVGFSIFLKAFISFRQKRPLNFRILLRALNYDALRSCLFFGGFTFTWKFLSRSLPLYLGYRSKRTDFISGFLAGLFILTERKDRRISFSQQLIVRAAQSLYDSLNSKNIIRIPHGDSILFTLSTAQILYSFVLHKTTLPSTIYNFMCKHAQIPDKILQHSRTVIAKEPLDITQLVATAQKMNPTPTNLNIAKNLGTLPEFLPCQFYHLDIDSCNQTFVIKFINVVKMILPVYAGLTFIPAIGLKFKSFKKNPLDVLIKCSFGSIRSSVFLAVLVSVYQYIICINQTVSTSLGLKQWKYIYYVAGIICAISSILIEKPSRRVELALYTAPKAIDSFYHILYKKNQMVCIPKFEVFMFMVASGAIMTFFNNEPEVISPLLRMVLNRLIKKDKEMKTKPKKQVIDEVNDNITH